MFIQFGPLDQSAVWLQNPANIKALAEKLARHMNRMVARSGCARLRQSTWLREHNVPHHCAGSLRCWVPSVPELTELSQAGLSKVFHISTKRCSLATVCFYSKRDGKSLDDG
jgi:hypothetical protein